MNDANRVAQATPGALHLSAVVRQLPFLRMRPSILMPFLMYRFLRLNFGQVGWTSGSH
jgi:hypothetical protein